MSGRTEAREEWQGGEGKNKVQSKGKKRITEIWSRRCKLSGKAKEKEGGVRRRETETL